jgi:predicted metal-dependent hydrolase
LKRQPGHTLRLPGLADTRDTIRRMPAPAVLHLPYLSGYPPELLAQVRQLIEAGKLAETVAKRHSETHDVRTERALYDYVSGIKSNHMRSAPPLAKVAYDPELHIVRNALGTHSQVSRVQGNKLKAKREIRIAALFKEAPADFLRMIVVHELAHLKEREHDKAFYALCVYMEPSYHQLEFDLRLWLTAQELPASGPVQTG